jgi:hypothetical protein
MLWEKQKLEVIEDDIKELEKTYENSPEFLTAPEELIVSIDGKKGLWSLEEVINLLRKNKIRFKIII